MTATLNPKIAGIIAFLLTQMRRETFRASFDVVRSTEAAWSTRFGDENQTHANTPECYPPTYASTKDASRAHLVMADVGTACSCSCHEHVVPTSALIDDGLLDVLHG